MLRLGLVHYNNEGGTRWSGSSFLQHSRYFPSSPWSTAPTAVTDRLVLVVPSIRWGSARSSIGATRTYQSVPGGSARRPRPPERIRCARWGARSARCSLRTVPAVVPCPVRAFASALWGRSPRARPGPYRTRPGRPEVPASRLVRRHPRQQPSNTRPLTRREAMTPKRAQLGPRTWSSEHVPCLREAQPDANGPFALHAESADGYLRRTRATRQSAPTAPNQSRP